VAVSDDGTDPPVTPSPGASSAGVLHGEQSATWGERLSTLDPVSDLTFTHLDPLGRARMVDVTPKEPTHRRAVARCKVFMQPQTTAAIINREVKKGDVLAVARVAGIQAAKRTSDLIPLCHPLLVGSVYLNFEIGDDFVEIEAQVDTVDRTGVEMEALHACSIAALTIYDMCKSADKGMVIGELALWEKTGGRSGTYRRPDSIAGHVTNVVEP
jgi:cyclic pyranopterin monophosphate synthase